MLTGNDLLQGEQVYLTAVTRADLEALYPFFTSMDYMRSINNGISYPHQGIDKIMEGIRGEKDKQQAYHFTIRRKSDQAPIGVCAAKNINWHGRHCEIEMGIGDPALRGKGCGTDAMCVLLKYIFMELNMNRAALQVASFNEAAIALYKKLGFTHEVTLREAVYRDLQYYDLHIMSILYREWAAKNDQ